MRKATFAILLASVFLCGGCNIFKVPLFLFLPDMGKTNVPAEYVFKPGEKVAVAVYAGMDTMFEYPFVREELSDAVAAQFKKHVDDVKVIDYAAVVEYQDANTYWHTQPLATLGKSVGADYVLYISVNEFRTYDPGSISLPHGIVNASAMLVKCEQARDAAGNLMPQNAVWTRSVISVDEDASVGPLFDNNAMLRQVIELKFSMKLAKAFYAHSQGAYDEIYDD